MAQLVWSDRRVKTCPRQVGLQAFLNDPRIDRSSNVFAGPKYWFFCFGMFPKDGPVLLDSLNRMLPNRRQAFLLSFASDADQSFRDIQIFNP